MYLNEKQMDQTGYKQEIFFTVKILFRIVRVGYAAMEIIENQ